MEALDTENRVIGRVGAWLKRSGTNKVVRLEGPLPYIDPDDLPISIALVWDANHRHSLGNNRRYCNAEFAPIDAFGLPFTYRESQACPAAFFSDCSTDCCPCRGAHFS